MAPIHDRMPVILSSDEHAPWMDTELIEVEQLLPMLNQYPAGEMAACPVSNLVNTVRNDSAKLVESIT